MTKNFSIDEMRCKDKDRTPVPSELMHNAKELLENLQVFRDYVDKPVTIISGYRTKTHNKAVGGKVASKHLFAQAADIQVIGMTPAEVFATIDKLINEKLMKQGGLEQYPTFVHYDVRGRKARW
jgi:uncharacterized protein YcbK (DUF882 family)